jgi:adenine-specific DNA-methyltransferase
MMETETTPQMNESDSIDTRLDGASLNIVAEKRRELLDLFPEARTERDKIDFDRLRLALGNSVDIGKERYGLTWPGKSECFKTIQAPSMATLLPALNRSNNFETTENLIIEGDSLEVLKLLQKSCLGKIKMIYIDPPYNTGNDFIYPDNYSESLQTYLEYTHQVDSDGKKFGTNTDADGRFHSKWLSMMYPRLYLARNLLRDDGVIFASIDDTEVAKLRLILDDIFGEENFVEQIVWKNKYGSGALTIGFANVHEYILCYSKKQVPGITAPLSEEAISEYRGRDQKFGTRGGFITQPLATKSKDERPNLRFPIQWNGKEVWPEKQWVWSRERVDEALAKNEIVFNEKNGKVSVRVKQYLRDEHGVLRRGKPISIMLGPFNQDGTREVDELLGEDVFDFPKPSALLRQLFSISTGDDDTREGVYLDFTAGSGTSAQAILDLNAKDGGQRRFLLVQLPEPTGRQDYPTIADICEERVRRFAKKLDDASADRLKLGDARSQDRGFRVFRLAESNVKEWDAAVAHDTEAVKEQLALNVDHLRHDRSDLDIVYEVLLKSGYPLSARVSTEAIDGKRVYSVADGAFLICLERNLSLDLIRAIAARKPERVLLLDEGFAGNDQLKTNAVQTFKAKNVVFRTL